MLTVNESRILEKLAFIKMLARNLEHEPYNMTSVTKQIIESAESIKELVINGKPS